MDRRAVIREASVTRLPQREGARSPAPPNVFKDDNADLAGLWRILVAHKRALLCAAAFAAVIAALFAWSIPSTYRATATLLVETGRARIVSIDELRQTTESREHFQAQAEILQSRELAVRTTRALKLWNEQGFDPRQTGSGPAGQWAQLTGSSNHEWIDETLLQAAVDALQESTKVEAVRLSGTIRLTVESQDPELSARIANTMTEQYLLMDRESRSRLARNVSSLLSERAVGLRARLARAEADLQTFREANGIVKLGTTQQSMIAQRLNGIGERLTTATARRIELEGAYKQLNRDGRKYFDVGLIQRDPAVATAKARVDTAALRLAEVSQNYGTEHALVKESSAQLAQAREALTTLQQALANSIVSDYEAALTTERELRRTLDQTKTESQGANRAEPQLIALEREVESTRQLYEMFQNRAKETSLSAEIYPAVARVIDPAVAPNKAHGPKRMRIVLLAAVIALSLAAFVLLVRQAFDRTVRTADQIEQRVRSAVLAVTPRLGRMTDSSAARKYLEEPRSRFAESIRTARIGIVLGSLEIPHKAVLITSSLAGEGKTTVATNLAIAYSRTRRTLLIDANLRRPRIASRLGLPDGLPGLSNLVSGDVPTNQCFHRLRGSKLHVLPSGNLAVNPQEMFLSPRFSRLIDALNDRFEVIIIDSPAVGPASDALLLSSMVSCSLVVARAGRVTENQLSATLERLSSTSAKCLGVVLNGAGRNNRSRPPMRGDPEADAGYNELHSAHQPETIAPAAVSHPVRAA